MISTPDPRLSQPMYTSSLKNFEELRRKHNELWLKSSSYLARVEQEIRFGPQQRSPSPKKLIQKEFDFKSATMEKEQSVKSPRTRRVTLNNNNESSMYQTGRKSRMLSDLSIQKHSLLESGFKGELGTNLPRSAIKLSKNSLFNSVRKLHVEERDKDILDSPDFKTKKKLLTREMIHSTLKKIEKRQAPTENTVSQKQAQIKRAVDPNEIPIRSVLHGKSTNDWFRSRMGRTVQTKYLYMPQDIKRRQQMMEIFDNFDEDGNAKLELDEFLGMFVSTYLHGKSAELSVSQKIERPEKLDRSNSLERSEKQPKVFPSSPKGGTTIGNPKSENNSVSKFTKEDAQPDLEAFATVHFRATKNIKPEERIPSAKLSDYEQFLLPRFQQFYAFITKKDYLTKEEFIQLAFDPKANEHFQETMKELAVMVERAGKKPEQEIPYTFAKMISYLGYSSRRDYLYKRFLNSRDEDYLDASNHLEDLLFLKSDQIKQEYDSNEKLRKYRMKTTSMVKSKAAIHLEAMGQFLTKLLLRKTNTKELVEAYPEEETDEAKSSSVPTGLKRLVQVDPNYVSQLKIDVKTQKKPQLALADKVKERIRSRIKSDLKTARATALEDVKHDLEEAKKLNSVLVYRLVRSNHLPQGYVKARTTSVMRDSVNPNSSQVKFKPNNNSYSLEGYRPVVDRVSTFTEFNNIRVKSSSKVRPMPQPGISEFDEVVPEGPSLSIDDKMDSMSVQNLPKPLPKPKLTKMTTVEFISNMDQPLDASVKRKDLSNLLRPIDQPRQSVAAPAEPFQVASTNSTSPPKQLTSQKPVVHTDLSVNTSAAAAQTQTDEQSAEVKAQRKQFAAAFLKAFAIKKD